MFERFWWTWSGSNRRPLPCHLRNINHLQTLPAKTKDLEQHDLDAGGRHGATLGRLDSTRTPGLHARNGTRRALTRAVAGTSRVSSAGEDNNWFHMRMMPVWSGGIKSVVLRCGSLRCGQRPSVLPQAGMPLASSQAGLLVERAVLARNRSARTTAVLG